MLQYLLRCLIYKIQNRFSRQVLVEPPRYVEKGKLQASLGRTLKITSPAMGCPGTMPPEVTTSGWPTSTRHTYVGLWILVLGINPLGPSPRRSQYSWWLSTMTHHISPIGPRKRNQHTCHKPCTATAHGHPTLLRTDLFKTVIECTATDHVIFSWCIYISFHGNLLPLAWIWVVIPHSLFRASLDSSDWGDSL